MAYSFFSFLKVHTELWKKKAFGRSELRCVPHHGFPLLESFLDLYETDTVGCETVKGRQKASTGP